MNNTSLLTQANATATCKDIPKVATELFIESVLKWVFLTEALGIIGLNAVLIFMLRRQRKQSRMAFFVQHLAISDLCVGVLYVLPTCIFERFLRSWEKYSCFILSGFCMNFVMCASTFLIVVLTIDRLYVIEKPLTSSKAGKKYRYGLVIGAWLLAVPLASVYAAHIEIMCTVQNMNLCYHRFDNIEAMIVAEAFINVFIPVTIIAFCYSWIFMIICKRERAGFIVQRVEFSNGETTLVGGVQRENNVITNAKKKTIKVLLVVIIVYIISWAPITLAQLLNVYGVLELGHTYKVLHNLAPINSIANPIVFIIFNRQMLQSDRNRKQQYHTSSSQHTAYESM